jgi:pimeloyl-ACP methyl ester carboxylesterase
MVHGNGNCLKDWIELGYIDALPEFKFILMDAIGYGDSDKSYESCRYTPENRAADVIALLDALEIEQCNFLGSSIGGNLGFVLAQHYPERFYAFTIGSAHAFGSTKEPSNLYPKDFLEGLSSTQDLVDVIEAALKAEGRDFIPALKQTFLNNDLKALIAANQLPWPDVSNDLDKIAKPVLLYAGDKDPVCEHTKACSDHFQLHIFENNTHADVYWNGQEIAPVVGNFFKSLSL